MSFSIAYIMPSVPGQIMPQIPFNFNVSSVFFKSEVQNKSNTNQ